MYIHLDLLPHKLSNKLELELAISITLLVVKTVTGNLYRPYDIDFKGRDDR